MRALPVLDSRADRTPPASVRISLTDRCDLACVYCRPHKHDGYFESTLPFDAWRAMLDGLVASGVRRVRITGGEPLLHPRVVDMVHMLDALGLEDIALTTNATRLADLARPLKMAGLRRLNISIDSLDADRFSRMTRGGKLDGVLRGIDAALEAGFSEIKTNTVVMRDENDVELADIVAWAWARGIIPRFLEVMAIGEGASLADRVVSAPEMRARLTHVLEVDTGERDLHRGPAKYVRARKDPTKRVGFITGTTDTYCDGCDRLRVSANGTLRPCLATNDGVSAREAAIRGDAGAVGEALEEAWEKKPDGRTWKGCTEPTARDVSIRAIGG